MTRVIEPVQPVQIPDICQWRLSAEPPRIMGRLTCAAAGLLSNNRPGPVAAPSLPPLSPTTSQCWHILPVARPGQAAHCPGPRVSPVLFLVFSRFLSDSNTAELHRPQTCAHSRPHILAAVRRHELDFQAWNILHLDASIFQGSGGFHDPRVALLEWTLDFYRDIASSAFNPARVQCKSALMK